MEKIHRTVPLEGASIATLVIALLLGSCSSLPPQAASRLPYVFPPGPTARELLLADRFAELDQRFSAAQGAYSSGKATDQELREAIREFYDTDPALAPKYDAWVAKFSESYVAHLARGIYYARAGETTEGIATAEITKSMRLDPRPIFSYAYAIFISMDEGRLSESRHWLDEADSIDAGNYVARARYMSAIETRWGGSQEMMQAFLEECRAANLSDSNMKLLESVVVEDQGWVHQFVDHDYAAAELAYRKSAALGGDKQLANLVVVLFEQRKFREALEPLTEELQERPDDPELLMGRSSAYFQAGLAREGLADLRVAADGGDATAQNNLGSYYMMGIEGALARDPVKGVEWFEKSAAQGYAMAKVNLERARLDRQPSSR
jgi:TPR repeat protein